MQETIETHPWDIDAGSSHLVDEDTGAGKSHFEILPLAY